MVASGSMKRRISQALASRSTNSGFRVAHARRKYCRFDRFAGLRHTLFQKSLHVVTHIRRDRGAESRKIREILAIIIEPVANVELGTVK